MAARFLSFLLGALPTGVGWAIVDPKGFAGARLPSLDLGVFEGHRAFIGWGAVALGVVALLSAVLPRDGAPAKEKRRGPPAVDFGADPAVDQADAEQPGASSADGRAPSPSSLW